MVLTKIFSIRKFYFNNKSFLYVLCFLLAWPFAGQAKDILKLNESRSHKKTSSVYNLEVLHRAMQITEPEFGEYDIQFVVKGVPNLRLRKMIAEGSVVNVTIMVSTSEWEKETVPIRIPVRRGILNYRLLLINKNTLEDFANINTIEQLKKKTIGLRRQWATWQTMTTQGYSVTNSFSYDAIFGMLSSQRFDYIPRGIHEIYEEIKIRQGENQNLMVEPNLALYIPAPFYVFISPKEPRLIRRLQLGLNRMVEQGILEDMLTKYYGKYLERADLKNRLILNVGNPILPPTIPLERKKLWLNWDEQKNGHD